MWFRLSLANAQDDSVRRISVTRIFCMERIKTNYFIFLITFVAALGGFLFGYDAGIISGALVFIRQTYALNSWMQECIVSAVILGALIGSLSSGKLADQFGSKKMLIAISITFIIGTLLSAFANNVSILLLGRFIVGIAIGITSYISPLFIAEISPAKNRGAFVLLNGIMITGGQAVAFFVDYALIATHSWRLMFATGLIPAILLFVGMLMLPTSPRWLILKGKINEARSTLQKIRNSQNVETELNEIACNLTSEKGRWSDVFSKTMRPVVLIGAGLGIFQQMMGINTVMSYGPTIFHAAGFTGYHAQLLATFSMGMINMLMTLVAILLVDKVGRRCMLLWGTSVAGISLMIVGFMFSHDSQSPLYAWTSFAFLVLYIAGYSASLGSLFWLVISEIYPLQIRSLAMSFVTAIQWSANLIVVLTFLSILNWIGPVYTFWMYAFMCIASFVFCYVAVPETRGITLEQIEANMRLTAKRESAVLLP